MSRQLKFRIWDKDKKEFANPYQYAMRLHYQDEYILHSPMVYSGYNYAYGDYQIQQFASILDKNNQEIYEGDICKWKWSAGEGQIEESTGEVFFENGIFYFGRELYFCTADVNFDELSLEVIGNIFENTKQPLTN